MDLSRNVLKKVTGTGLKNDSDATKLTGSLFMYLQEVGATVREGSLMFIVNRSAAITTEIRLQQIISVYTFQSTYTFLFIRIIVYKRSVLTQVEIPVVCEKAGCHLSFGTLHPLHCKGVFFLVGGGELQKIRKKIFSLVPGTIFLIILKMIFLLHYFFFYFGSISLFGLC